MYKGPAGVRADAGDLPNENLPRRMMADRSHNASDGAVLLGVGIIISIIILPETGG